MAHTFVGLRARHAHFVRRVEILGVKSAIVYSMTMLDNRTWTLAKRLKNARLLAGLEQAELAKLIGASRNSISNYENGHTEPSVTTFVLWAEATSASLEWLAEGVVRPEGFEPPTY